MKNMDDILKQALIPKDEPDFWLNQNILSQAKEVTTMKKTNHKKLATIIISCAFALCIGSVSIYAAWKYLTPDQLIDELTKTNDYGDTMEDLKDAFTEKNAVYINETQKYGGYTVTLLGITSGENLTKYKSISDGVEQTNRSYMLFALEHDTLDISNLDSIGIFPMVMGYDYDMNLGLFQNGCGFQHEKDGIFYYLFECDNLEKFADRDIYVCVSDDLPTVSEYSYIYDQTAGTIARNEEYEGLNALFSLPLDPSMADPEAAAAKVAEREQHIQALKEAEKNAAELPLTKTEKLAEEAFAFVEQITPENINEYATPLTEEGAVQTFGPADKQGRITINSSYDKAIFTSKIVVDEMFPDGKTDYISSTGIQNADLDTLLIEYYKLNEDGTITLQFYKPNLPK